MTANRIFALGALFTLVSGILGCNSVLGIEEKTRAELLADSGGIADSGGLADSGSLADSGGHADGGSLALTIVKPPARADGTQSAVRLVRGSDASVDLAVDRSGGFDGTVIVLVSGLARGITAKPLILLPSQSAGTLTIHAADSADLGPSSLSILGAHDSLVSSPLDVPFIVQDAPGTPDKTFGDGGKVVLPVGSGGVGPGGIRLQSNGSLVLCGHAKREGVDSSIAIARITTSGALDPTFAQGAGFALGNSAGSKADSCAAVFLRPNGGIVFTGFATPEADRPRVLLTGRYRPDGFPDQNFGTPAGGFGTTPLDGTGSDGYSVVGPTVDDTFVVGGLGRGRPALLRFNKNGLLDPTFGSEQAQELSAPGGIRWLAQQANETFVAAIESSTFLVARFSSNGALDKTFGDAGTKSVAIGDQGSSAAVVLAQPDDAVLAIGTQTLAAGATDVALARLTKSGQLDPAFGVAGIGTVHFAGASTVSSAVESDGSIVIAGRTSVDSGPAFTVLRVSRDGSLDTTFGTAGRQVLGVGMAQAITVDDLGRIIVAGFSGGTPEGSLVVYRLWP
jgi:uncharacterized delta-60 repeat protein